MTFVLIEISRTQHLQKVISASGTIVSFRAQHKFFIKYVMMSEFKNIYRCNKMIQPNTSENSKYEKCQ